MKRLGGKTILVVDDEEMLREILTLEFTAAGAKVVEATNGLEAFGIIMKRRFDAVFADLKMPGGDGMLLLEKISKHLKERPLIFLCTGLSDISLKDMQRLGIAAIIRKPFHCSEMLQTVCDAFKKVS